MADWRAFQRFVRSPGALALALGLLLGCQPHIGDDCETSADCSANGDRLCDITQPSGYCTIFNCEPGTCPDESVCIVFSASSSTVPGCENAYGTSPYQRSFCMKTCSGESDCRSKYSCIDVGGAGNPWGAVVADKGESGKVCMVPYTAAPLPDDRSHDVCSATSSGEFEYPPDAGAAQAGAGGEGGQSAAGSSGAPASGVGGA
jgi:hypothetical protein